MVPEENILQIVEGQAALRGRVLGTARTSGFRNWRTVFLGSHVPEVQLGPQVFLDEMAPDSTISPHFHQVDQFSVFVAGNGTLGRNAVPPLSVHYVDHHTAYGPIVSGAGGLTIFTIRVHSDPGGIHLHQPDYRARLKPTKRRYLLAEHIPLSIAPVLQSIQVPTLSPLFPDENADDGLGAWMLRMGADATITGPDPDGTGGQYALVVNGSLDVDGELYRPWSVLHVNGHDGPRDYRAGRDGLEALVLSFPRSAGEQSGNPATDRG